MTDRPKASRMERQVRNLGRGLFWLSSTLLIVCMAMTGLFGWSLGTDYANKALYAVGYGATDAGGAVIMGFCGTCFAMRQRTVGVGAFLCAVVCFVISLSAIIGFQASNREALAQARERASTVGTAYLDWSKTAVTDALAADKAKGKPAQPATLVSGIQAVGDQVEKQIKMLQSGETIALPDGQAYTLGKVMGVKEADARSWSIASGSGALLLIQYFCLWAYGFARHRLEPAIAAQQVAAGIPKYSTGKLANSSSFTDADAREDLDRLLASGYVVSNISFLARRWGWPPNTTGRWLRRQPDLKIAPPGRRGQRKSVERGDNAAPALNGRAHAV